MVKRLTFGPLRALLVLAAMVLGLASQAEARKLALVVGNEAYQHIPGLANPANDARAMSEALRRLGFEVTLLTDVSTEVFWVVLDTFGAQAQQAESAVFFYSGHAFQLEGRNHLVPVSATLKTPESLRSETWDLDRIVAKLQSGSNQTLIFLDACRTNPLPDGAAPISDGLAQIETDAGTFVAFATRPGAVALDRETGSDNSPFTRALLDHIETPGISVSDLMIRVRNDVESRTEGAQTPWEQSSLRAQFAFAPQADPDAMPEFEIAAETTLIAPAVTEEPPAPELVPVVVAPVAAPAKAALLAALGPLPAIQKIEAAEQPRLAALSSDTRAVPVVSPAEARVVGIDATPAPKAVPAATAAAPALGLGPKPTDRDPAPAPVLAAPVPADLPRAVQDQLKRIGCYTMAVDGDWGNGSRRALGRYYNAKKVDPAETEPTAALYTQLLAEKDGFCPPQVAAPTKAAAPVKKKSTPKATQKAPAQKTATKKTEPKKAAPKVAAKPEKKGMECAFYLVAVVCK